MLGLLILASTRRAEENEKERWRSTLMNIPNGFSHSLRAQSDGKFISERSRGANYRLVVSFLHERAIRGLRTTVVFLSCFSNAHIIRSLAKHELKFFLLGKPVTVAFTWPNSELVLVFGMK